MGLIGSDEESGSVGATHSVFIELESSQPEGDGSVAQVACEHCQSFNHGGYWLDNVRVGYEDAFVIASRRPVDLGADRYPYQLRINGWGQLRHTKLESDGANDDLNQFQLKRGRLVLNGSAFTPDIHYLLQLDGRSSNGDDVRLLDYVLSFDFGHRLWGLSPGTVGFRTGKYKMPFTMARWMTGKEFQFTDRSMASMYFDVNRSFAWGLYGTSDNCAIPSDWEVAVFNGLVTGGAETGSTGNLDNNFAYSGRLFLYPCGDWGTNELADLEWHDDLATRVGLGYANSTIDRSGFTEFSALRVVDSGLQLSTVLPGSVTQYTATLFAMHASAKFRGASATMEYYFRNVNRIRGAAVPDLFDHGFWLQLGKFVIERELELLVRWSRVVGDSGTLGADVQSSDEIAGGFAWYFRDQHVKLVVDLTHLNGAPIDSSSLDITPGESGWLVRNQIQFSF